MSDMEINRVIAQMRTLATEMNSPASRTIAEPKPADEDKFSNVLRGAIDKVNEQSNVANEAVDGFLHGDDSQSLAEVMVATQKASISFRAMTEVRNRLIEAYREVMNMPI